MGADREWRRNEDAHYLGEGRRPTGCSVLKCNHREPSALSLCVNHALNQHSGVIWTPTRSDVRSGYSVPGVGVTFQTLVGIKFSRVFQFSRLVRRPRLA